ncbi:MAG: hypothetical protein COV34_00515 [Candidatus Zambryskibacteria bacterium CG10_big_fil_rev_8_21_14_0_10_42_12]|uniref:Isoleucine--tRNA ligase n=1 Tax=Candidatus Zambryskibacteria bacterium CG10_big_fil_rev_8_21_14_0_10_42_12 TaxID=1975115 RepID=A0A2H0QWZ9_9BACT|nr:MAG: hypothetical protein COV34_00515 [Candidatus Zambryskibacteria bacterium CG10_big_fil_rev_8_21_14_0_10_42_12]
MDGEAYKSDIAKREEGILNFWKENNIFTKSLEKESPKGEFVFYDGPPFATGLPHYGHLLPGTIKDVIPRYKTMRGYHVSRRWGWDCHGLPVENLIEKELGLETKKDIEVYGVEKFNEAARDSVLRYADDWREIIPRSGRWVDMDNDYKTMEASYTESVWWAFKNLYDKGLVYEGFKSMHICPRCETTLSNFEVNQGYKDVTDISVYVKFKLIGEPDTYLLAWTTTPWTLPGNVALAVGEDIDYVEIEKKDMGEGKLIKFICAKERLAPLFGSDDFEILRTIKGKDLIGKSYEPLFDYYAKDESLKNRENGWKVYGADFVTTEDGTGIVHIAPAFGTDDMELGKEYDLPFVQHVTMDGHMKPEVADFAGMMVKPKSEDEKERLSTDIAVLRVLQENGAFFDKEKITHSYPHCWRCDTPLLNYAASSWFIEVSKVREKLVKLNNGVSWVPESIGENRFGNWLSEAKDWSISRGRFWGAPLPVWKCASCNKVEVLESIDDLKKHTKTKNTYYVMRHGESDHNVGNFISTDPNNNSHLTDVGREQVLKTAENLKKVGITKIITSPFARTKETTELVAGILGISKDNIIHDERVGELKVGDVYEGKTIDEYHEFFTSVKDRFMRAPEGGETLTDLVRRVGEFLYSLESTYEGENILIISHEATINTMHMVTDAKSIDDAVSIKLDDHENPKTAEAKELGFWNAPHNKNYWIDLHRPYIDEVEVYCDCGEKMSRIPEVFDTWFDSGSMPYAQNNYPFKHKEAFENKELFPADFIAEGLDQTRGWFYTLLVLNGLLFDESPYKHVVVNGLVLAEDGKKMSKRLKNYPELSVVFDKYGADALRYYLMSSPAVRAEDVALSEKGIDEVAKKNIGRLVNVLSFYEMYQGEVSDMSDVVKGEYVLDRWILVRLFETRNEVTTSLDAYEIDRATRPLAVFIDDLSTWYLRRSRDRFKSGNETDEIQVRTTLRYVLREFAKLVAPFMPFIAEHIYIRVKLDTDAESVHLVEWPEEARVDQDLLGNMERTRAIVSLALEARAKANIKVRQPLASLAIPEALHDDLLELIKDEVNVKVIETGTKELSLDTHITDELKKEGRMRDIVRLIQDERKKNNFVPSDMVDATFDASDELKEIIEEFSKVIKKETGLKDIEFKELSGEKRKIDDLEIGIVLKK